MNLFVNTLLVLTMAVFQVQGASHHPQQFLQEIAGKKDEGKQIYQHFCSNCHAVKSVINVGAPKIGILADWQQRVKDGYGGLILHTNEGYNAMPARGGCFECTDQQLYLAILYMLPKQLKNGLISDHKELKQLDQKIIKKP